MRSRSSLSLSSALVLVLVAACSLEQGGTGLARVADAGPVLPVVDASVALDADATSEPGDADATVDTEGFVQVSVGPLRACAVTSKGGVKCWGSNTYGGAGDDSFINRPAPVDVKGLIDAKAVAVGRNHTCALTVAGAVTCWGGDTYGQLGDAATDPGRGAPVPTSGLTSGVVAITAGDYHACALTAAGGVKCWGKNDSGQLGDNTVIDQHAPVDVSGLTSGVTAIAAGASHTCALTAAGGVKCWGLNDVGQLGNNSTTDKKVPDDVTGLATGVSAIAAGASHTCAVLATGAVKCWGANDTGQLGDNSVVDRKVPVDVVGLTGASVIAAGAAHTCAKLATGAVQCWGDNTFEELADGTTSARPHPGAANVGGVVSSIDAGGNVTCAIIPATGKTRCWGRPDDGALGDGKAFVTTPTTIASVGTGATAISSGPYRTCALKPGPVVTCWGDDKLPADVAGVGAVNAISVGSTHVCTMVGAGIKCFGDNVHGQLGDNTVTARPAPTDVTGLTSGVATVAAGGEFTCARTTGGGAKCWGRNDVGQVGDNSKTERHVAVDVFGLTTAIAAVDTGTGTLACAITSTGTVACWGNGTQFPVVVPTVAGATSIAVGPTHACAIVAAGAVKCWGANGNGQLGDGTQSDSLGGVTVFGLTGAIALALGGTESCAIVAGGAVKCWGSNGGGQLGDGTTTDHSSPVDAIGVTGATAISVGSSFVCTVIPGGAVSCWGRADRCKLGACISRGPVDVL